MIGHKIICWGDYAIPVPTEYKWLAMDKDGRWWIYEHKPYLGETIWLTLYDKPIELCQGISPPEPGSWTDQLYWIGD